MPNQSVTGDFICLTKCRGVSLILSMNANTPASILPSWIVPIRAIWLILVVASVGGGVVVAACCCCYRCGGSMDRWWDVAVVFGRWFLLSGSSCEG